jgi:hypothetical protein
MNRRDHRVRCGGEKAIDEVGAWDRFRFRSAIAFELGPYAGEERERPIVARNRNGAAICDTGKVRRRAIRSTLCSSTLSMRSLATSRLLVLGGQAPITMSLSGVLTRKFSTFFLECPTGG